MDVKETNRREMEEKIKTMGDFVKINYLNNSLKKHIDFDTRRYALMKLAELYEKRRMFLDAGKMILNAAPINPLEKGKVVDLMKATELFIKGGKLDEADIAFDKAMAYCKDSEKYIRKRERIDWLKKQAEEYLSKDKRSNAMVIFEKLLTFSLIEPERKEVQEKLLNLYSRLGKIREYYNLRNAL